MQPSTRSRWLLACALPIYACATIGGMRQEPLDAGVVHEFPGDFATVLRATRTAAANAGLAVDSYDQLNDSTAVIMAKRGNARTSGERIRLVVQGSSNNRVSVRVLTERKIANATKGSSPDELFSNIEMARSLLEH